MLDNRTGLASESGAAGLRDRRRWFTIVAMGNLVAKIRSWLHLDKKPKS